MTDRSATDVILYVGGLERMADHFRQVAANVSAEFIHHEGRMTGKHRSLAQKIDRATIVLFPVDCVSHEAVWTLKRLCRRAGKPFQALRSSGVGSFTAAVEKLQTRPAA